MTLVIEQYSESLRLLMCKTALSVHLAFHPRQVSCLTMAAKYTEDNIRTLDWKEHIRLDLECTLENWEMGSPQMMVSTS